jgi:hypothetical protein
VFVGAVRSRGRVRAMGRSPCCDKEGLKKGPWTPEEDQKLLAYIEQHGHGCWRSLPAKAGENSGSELAVSSRSCFSISIRRR